MKVYCDNTTTIAYINKSGGTRSPNLMHLAQKIWTYCLKTNTRLNLTYIPSAFNPADAPSRQLIRQLEWRIDQIFFQKLEKKWGPYHVDLFAHKRNHHLPRYVTWKWDPTAIAMDAMSISWKNMINVYACPPWNLLPQIIAKIQRD
jgi:hypothetical protein